MSAPTGHRPGLAGGCGGVGPRDRLVGQAKEAWMKKILYITITAMTVDEMWTVYFFAPEQNRVLAELNRIFTS